VSRWPTLNKGLGHEEGWVVGADHASTVVDTVLKDGGDRSFVFVVPVEPAYPAETVKTDDAVVPAG
jgi:hypothetical protein